MRAVRRFLRAEDGVTILEGLMVIPIVLLVYAAVIEFGFAVYQWNQAVKAMQHGARLAAVSDVVLPDADWTALGDFSSTGQQTGQAPPPPIPLVAESCGPGDVPCKVNEMNWLIFGGDGVCDPNFGSTKPGMCDLNRHIGVNNVHVTYARSGLGYVGHFNGPVVTITLESRNLRFRLPMLGALLGLNNMEIPAHPVSITSEDLSTPRL